MVRVLHIVGSLERNGIETFLMNVYRNIDRTAIQFDFAIYNEPSNNSYADEVKQLGGKIFIVPKKSSGLLKCYKSLKRIIQENNYRIVWRNTDSCIGGLDLLAAKSAGATARVLHAHSSSVFGIAKYLHYVLRPLCNMVATKRIACSKNAASWMFGNRDYELIPNGVDTDKYRYNTAIRSEYRKKYNIADKLVIGFVGRLEEVKNPFFLIEVFHQLAKKRTDAVLMIAGTGAMEGDCKAKVDEYKLSDKVIFLGSRNDVPQLLQCFDVFVMTSFYEGFPVSLIEAQAAGLPCVLSDVISKETDLIGQVKYISFNDTIEKWCSAIEKSANNRVEDGDILVAEKGYDIRQVAKRIMGYCNNI